ncbi:hypothetical protein ANANG_G00299530 [Anguilla anguilla]|uniref:Uncharacterized protein n=1 Tax=Anguilla anguilla TaxID=7936 RepID=A0A9D3RI73_ANGAN|nr:hypothetical protein ANANG_G00299530 [Anguilla anguilla]
MAITISESGRPGLSETPTAPRRAIWSEWTGRPRPRTPSGPPGGGLSGRAVPERRDLSAAALAQRGGIFRLRLPPALHRAAL